MRWLGMEKATFPPFFRAGMGLENYDKVRKLGQVRFPLPSLPVAPTTRSHISLFLNHIEKGSFGAVYLMRDKRDNNLYVMKEIDLTVLGPKGRKEALKEVGWPLVFDVRKWCFWSA